MKRIILCAAAVSLIAFAPAYAQNNDHRGDNRDAATPTRGARMIGKSQHRSRPLLDALGFHKIILHKIRACLG